jgi:hypothetical protein
MNIVEELKEQMKALEAKIVLIQTECVHPASAVTEKCDGSSGNYDPSADGSWSNFHCRLCDKRWTVDH